MQPSNFNHQNIAQNNDIHNLSDNKKKQNKVMILFQIEFETSNITFLYDIGTLHNFIKYISQVYINQSYSINASTP